MDLKAYYKKIREAEKSLQGDYQLMVSLATPDGGKEGVITEVATEIASRLMVERKARRANEEEARRFRTEQKGRREAFEKSTLARTLHVELMRGLETAVERSDGGRKS